MSLEAMTWALSVPVGGNTKVVLLGVANHAHPDGTRAYPSLETLALYAHCDRSTARRNLRKLEDDGWLVRAGLGPQGQACWSVPMARDPFAEEGDEAPPEGVAKCHGGVASGVAPGVASGVAPMPPEPLTVNRKEGAEAPSSLRDPIIVDLCQRLASRMLANDPKADVNPDSAGWYREMRQLTKQRGAPEVERIIDWSQADRFWHTNILSPAKLRKQFGQLLLKAKAESTPAPNQRPNASSLLRDINSWIPEAQTPYIDAEAIEEESA